MPVGNHPVLPEMCHNKYIEGIFQSIGALMDNNKTSFTSIDEYIAVFPEGIQKLLQEIRAIIHAAAPDAQEKISYQMPAFAQKGILVYFAARKDYIGFYPTSSGTEAFQQKLSAYEYTKGSIKFPLDKPLPTDLITKIVKFRLAENLKKAKEKSSQGKQHRP
jgi:uncharacterized protein YdhG (YjbR/CyaY superfamily)